MSTTIDTHVDETTSPRNPALSRWLSATLVSAAVVATIVLVGSSQGGGTTTTLQHDVATPLVTKLATRRMQLSTKPRMDEAATGGNGNVVMLEWALPGNHSSAERYRTLTRGLIEPTQQEPGCLHFDVYEDVVQGEVPMARIWQYIVFKDEDAHTAHMAAAYVAKWETDIAGLIQNSSVMQMRMALQDEHPVQCIKQHVHVLPSTMLVVLVKMYTKDPSQWQLLQQASTDLIKPTRAESGVLYYDQLIPSAIMGRTKGKPETHFVQEVFWFVNAEAHHQHMQSRAVQQFMEVAAAAKPQFHVTEARSYTALPACGVARSAKQLPGQY